MGKTSDSQIPAAPRRTRSATFTIPPPLTDQAAKEGMDESLHYLRQRSPRIRRSMPPPARVENATSGRRPSSSPPSERKIPLVLGSLSKEGVHAAIRKELKLYGRSDKRKDERDQRIRLLSSCLSPVDLSNFIYSIFAPHYDDFMTTHAKAIDGLLHQLVALEAIAFGEPRQIIREDVLEMSCGTGTIIKSLCDALPMTRVKSMGFTANDINDDMRELAKKKLRYLPCTIEYTSQEMSAMSFGRKFGTVILSQTLHQIKDEDVLKQERSDNYMHLEESEKRHVYAKLRVIENAYNMLEDNGTFIVIDEWPPKISDRGGRLGTGFEFLFDDSLREIDWTILQRAIMSQLPSASFVAHLKVPIDKKHAMHLMVYRKDPDKYHTKVPPFEPFEEARESARGMVVKMFSAINSNLRDSLRPPSAEQNPWVRLLSMKRRSSSYHDEIPSGEYNCIVIANRIHRLTTPQRFRMLSRARDIVNVGGSLIIVDEWPSPGRGKSISTSTLLDVYMPTFANQLVYAGAVRVPILPPHRSGMYGFQFKKVP